MATREDALRHLWRRGILGWKIRGDWEYQRPLFDAIRRERESLITVVNCSRQFGKTFNVCLFCTEYAIQHPGARIRYAAPTEKSLRTYIKPNMRAILADCPRDLRPKWNSLDSCFIFPNGSEWHLAGTDAEHAEKLRGPSAHLCIADEAGAMDNLRYVVNDVLVPQTLTTEGRVIVISTPPVTPGHEFHAMAERARSDGAYIEMPVTMNARLMRNPRQLAKLKKASGGEESTTWQREYMCRFIVDANRAVVPEFDDKAEAEIVREPEIPPYFRPLVAMDVGFEDFTAVLFGYYDFVTAKLVIQDELFLRHMTTDTLAKAIADKELLTWSLRKVSQRVSDIDLIVLNDLAVLHGLHFAPTAKDDKDAQINTLRLWVKERKLVIDPKCKTLIRHLRTAVWTKRRDQFERTEDDGHYDGVDALVYMLRNAPLHDNPYPAYARDVMPHTHLIPSQSGARTEAGRVFENAFGRR